MKKNPGVPRIIVHNGETMTPYLGDRVNEFYVSLIERRLGEANLPVEEKIAILDAIIAAVKLREEEESGKE